MLVHADYNQIYEVHQKYSTIPTSLIIQASTCLNRLSSENLYESEDTLEEIKKCFFYLFDTFDCAVVEFIDQGLFYLVNQFLSHPMASDKLTVCGLQIFERISQVAKDSQGNPLVSMLLPKYEEFNFSAHGKNR